MNRRMRFAKALVASLFSLFGRRRHPRTPVAIAVEWHRFGSKVRHRSETVDLGAGGAMVSSANPTPPGSPVVVALATRAGPVEVHARVAWSEPTRMGLRFTRPLSAATTAG